MVNIYSLRLKMEPFFGQFGGCLSRTTLCKEICIASSVTASSRLCVHLIPPKTMNLNAISLHIGKDGPHKSKLLRIFCDPCQWQTETWLDKLLSGSYIIHSSPVWWQ